MFKKSQILVIALVIALIAPLTVSAQVEEPILNLHFQKNNVFIPHAVALKKGWFTEAGFTKVELKTFSAGALAGEALLAGELAVWMPGNVPIISMRHNALPVVVVGNICSVYEKVVVRPDADIKNMEDLLKVRIGLLKGSTASAVLANLAGYYKLDLSKFNTVNLAPPEQITALAANEVQALIVWEPIASKAKQAVNGRFVFDSNISRFEKDNGTPFAASHTVVPIVFSEDFIREKPKTAKAIVAVLARATEYVQDPANTQEVIEIFAALTERSVASVTTDWPEYIWNVALDQKFLDDMQNYTENMERMGRISNAQSPLTYTYTGFLEEINPEYAKIKGGWKP